MVVPSNNTYFRNACGREMINNSLSRLRKFVTQLATLSTRLSQMPHWKFDGGTGSPRRERARACRIPRVRSRSPCRPEDASRVGLGLRVTCVCRKQSRNPGFPPSAGAEGAQAGGGPGECGLSRGTSGHVDNVDGVATFVGTTREQWGVAEM